MTRQILKSGTALTIALSLSFPALPLAQSQDIPPCENPQGKLWAEIIGPGDYEVPPDFEAPADGALAGAAGGAGQLLPGQGVCVIALPEAQLHVKGAIDADGGVMVRKPAVIAAAERIGLRVSGQQGQAATLAQQAQQQAQEQSQQPELQQQLLEQQQQLQQQQAQQQQAQEQLREQAQQQLDQLTGNLQEQQPVQQEPDADSVGQQAQQQLDQLTEQLQEQQQVLEQADENVTDQQAQQQASEQEVGQQDTLSSTEAANQTVAAQAAAGEDTEAEVETETETVTEAQTRSSAEDFATSVTGQPRQAQGDDGSSRLQDFALGALGALAVGQILDSGAKVVANSGDRVVVQRDDGEYEVLKDDNTLLRRPGTSVTTQRFSDGSSRETVTRGNGAQIVTIKTADGQVLRRTRIMPNGREVVLFDDTARVEPVDLSDLPRSRQRAIDLDAIDTEDLRAALAAAEASEVGRRFSLQQVRQIRAVRELVPVIELDAINFNTDSAAIRPSEADELRDLGVAMQRMIDANPYEVFLVEGHTDAVGSASYNLALSDRRAESVALALTEYFGVLPENMVVQGYGEANLKVLTAGPERENRRATVRRITPLLYRADAQ